MIFRLAGAALVLSSLGLSCGSDPEPTTEGGGGPTSETQAAPGGTSTTPAPSSSGTTTTPPDEKAPVTGAKLRNVFVIVMENHSWSTIKGSASAPYINGTLLKEAAHAESYSTPPGLHPSEPNYIWLEAGDNLGITTDDDPKKNHQSTTDHLTSQLEKAGISWKSYVENIDGTSCPLTSKGLYGAKHVPQLYFDDVTDTNSASSKHCIDHIRPYSELSADLTANKAPRFSFITPNLCNDMHGEVFGTTCQALIADTIKLGDDWLSKEVPKIVASQAYQDGGALFIVFDEGDESLGSEAEDGPIPMFVLSPNVKKGYSSPTAFTHSSMLRTWQTIFGVPYLRGAKTSNDLSEMFTSFP